MGGSMASFDVNTKTDVTEYAFVARSAPHVPNFCREFADENYMSLLLWVDEGGWNIYLTGAQTARKDPRGRSIQVSIFLRGSPGAFPDDLKREDAFFLLSCWLDACARSDLQTYPVKEDPFFVRFGHRVDDDLGRFFPSTQDEEEFAAEGWAVLRSWRLEQTAAVLATDGDERFGRGGIRDEEARRHFLACCRAVMEGRSSGGCLFLNNVMSLSDLPASIPAQEPYALLSLGDERWVSNPKGHEGERVGTPPPQARQGERRMVLVLPGLMLVGLALLALLWNRH
jgi:hypothetical protein